MAVAGQVKSVQSLIHDPAVWPTRLPNTRLEWNRGFCLSDQALGRCLEETTSQQN
jgi:hypothetical protein